MPCCKSLAPINGYVQCCMMLLTYTVVCNTAPCLLVLETAQDGLSFPRRKHNSYLSYVHLLRWMHSGTNDSSVCRNTAMTSSEDGTLRLWDTSTVVQKMVIKPSLQRAARVTVSACAYNSNGSSIAAGLVDGSIQVWDAKGTAFPPDSILPLLLCYRAN